MSEFSSSLTLDNFKEEDRTWKQIGYNVIMWIVFTLLTIFNVYTEQSEGFGFIHWIMYMIQVGFVWLMVGGLIGAYHDWFQVTKLKRKITISRPAWFKHVVSTGTSYFFIVFHLIGAVFFKWDLMLLGLIVLFFTMVWGTSRSKARDELYRDLLEESGVVEWDASWDKDGWNDDPIGGYLDVTA